jgi:hypothetical protein
VNTKSLSILLVVTIIVVVAAVSLTQTKAPPPKGKLFPKLATTIEQVTEVNVKTNTETMTIVRDENWNWQMQEKQNYPVEADKVNSLLLAMTELTILEPKTSNLELYSKIGVDDISDQDSHSILLTLRENSNILASLIIGNSKAARIDSTRNEIYVRKPDDKQVWLALGKLSVDDNLNDWLESQIIDINSEEIRQVKISNGENITIFKDTPADDEFQLADLPANGKVKMPYVLKNIATTLSSLKFDDVIAIDDLALEPETTVVFTTFAGLELTMQITKKDEKNYVVFEAKFNSEAVLPSDSKGDDSSESEPDVNKQVATLNAKFAGWVYELSEYKVDDLAKTREELIEIEEVEEELLVEELGTPTTGLSVPFFVP